MQTVTEVNVGRHLVRKRRGARVVWVEGTETRERRLDAQLVIGAAGGANVVLSDRRTSRLHAELELTDAGVVVRDLGSSNGTWLGATRIERACLTEDTQLRVGATVVSVLFDAAPRNVPLWPDDHLGPLFGASEAMRELFMQLSQAAAADAPVLLQGETGTGKELLAQELHALSPRASGPFVVVDCGALPESLIESELFGHVKGAFTGATHDKAGAFEDAGGGTIFLDEVGELPLAVQPRLLRVLESRTVRRLGQNQHRAVDVRFVAATHRDLPEMVAQGTFREDLYFRLAVLPLTVPPLRARRGDLAPLLERFLRGRAAVTPALLERLQARAWPGNVRELRAFAERLVALGPERAVAMMEGTAEPSPAASATSDGVPAVDLSLPFKDLRERWVSQLEREYLRGLFAKHGRDVTRVAELAGLDRSYVHRLIRKHGL
jgi:DNA-binding NtrC family response regulator